MLKQQSANCRELGVDKPNEPILSVVLVEKDCLNKRREKKTKKGGKSAV